MHEVGIEPDSLDEVSLARGQAWMVIFSDVLLLLLTFFVLRFSMLSLEGSSVARAFSKFNAASHSEKRPQAESLTTAALVARPEQQDATSLVTALADGLAAISGEAGLPAENGGVNTPMNNVLLQPIQNGALVRLPGGSFTPGEAEMSFMAARLLTGIGRGATGEGAAVEVIVWASPEEVLQSTFHTAWELSRARADRILRQLLGAGVPPYAISLAPRGDFPSSGRESAEKAKNGVELRIKTIK